MNHSNVLSPAGFMTREQAEVRSTGSLNAYWRLRDPLCAQILQLGCDPAHFPAVKAFFPFIRNASVVRLPRTFELLPSWLGLAFHSGFLFASRLPTEAEDILDQHGIERAEALRRVLYLRDRLGKYPATPINLFYAFLEICKEQFSNIRKEHRLEILVTYSFNAFKAGLASATLAKADPALVEFVEPITSPLSSSKMPLSWRMLMLSPLQAHGMPPWKRLAHPLPKLAATHYLNSPRERELILPCFVEQLTGAVSENTGPVAERDLEQWVRKGLEYGRQVKANAPERLAEVLVELGERKLAGVREVVDGVVKRANGMDPVPLTAAILEWHKTVYDWHGLKYYGQLLDRVAYCVDFAIWVPWAG